MKRFIAILDGILGVTMYLMLALLVAWPFIIFLS